MLLVEELFLLLRRADGRPEDSFVTGPRCLAAAALFDLGLAGTITFADSSDPTIALGTRPEPSALFDDLLTSVAKNPQRPFSATVASLDVDLESHVGHRLAQSGVVTVKERKLMGLIPERYPLSTPEAEGELRTRLAGVLSAPAGPASVTDTILLGLLEGLGVSARVLDVERGDLTEAELRSKISEIVDATRLDSELSPQHQAVIDIVADTALLEEVFSPVVIDAASQANM